MIGAVETFNQELDRRGKPRIGMGVGVNTGPTLIGNIGSKARFGYDVLGDSVSTAARLEGQSKPYGTKIIIGPETAKLVDNIYAVLELDLIQVKGKTVGLPIYTVLGRHDELMSTMNYVMPTQQHNKMIELYRAKCFDAAIRYSSDLKGMFNGMLDDYYTMWIERCEEMKKADLPEDWNGVFISKTK
jgi:adenylate cyclase